MELERIFFKTDKFDIEDGEDSETNPEIYGKQFAVWLNQKLLSLGYETEEIIPEDWGWCLMCEREEGMLWVGCASYIDGEIEDGLLPNKQDVTWHCFAAVELPIFKRLFSGNQGKRRLEKLQKELRTIIQGEKSFQIVQEPE